MALGADEDSGIAAALRRVADAQKLGVSVMWNLVVRGSMWSVLCVLLGCGIDQRASVTTFGLSADPVSSEPIEGVIWFEDITSKSNLQFVHDAGANEEEYPMPQEVGSGAAILDIDNDGRLDLYLIHNGGPTGNRNQLFRQQEDRTFVDISDGSGLDIAGWGMGVASGDVNNDGQVDLALFEYGRTRLLLNLGAGHFQDVSDAAQISNPLWAISGAFFDYDRDGWLDLVVVNYVDYDPTWPCYSSGGSKDYCAPSAFSGTASKLFHNRGIAAADKREAATAISAVCFEEVSVLSGIGEKAAPSLGVYCADLTGDGWDDILVANDGKNNFLWVNQRDGRFIEEAVVRGLACNGFGRTEANMGLAVGDFDGNGLSDVFCTHLSTETHTYWAQEKPGLFEDRTTRSGISAGARATGFGTIAADFDLDGDLDLAVVAGRVIRGKPSDNTQLSEHWRPYADRNQLFRNERAGQFREVSVLNPPFCGTDNVARGLAAGDLDDDGGIDLVLTTIAGPARLFRNAAPRDGRHWLSVRAWLPAAKRDALGAVVRVRIAGQQQARNITTSGSYGCCHDPRAHFGLGDAANIDSLEVRWPDGNLEEFSVPGVDQAITVKQGEGKPIP